MLSGNRRRSEDPSLSRWLPGKRPKVVQKCPGQRSKVNPTGDIYYSDRTFGFTYHTWTLQTYMQKKKKKKMHQRNTHTHFRAVGCRLRWLVSPSQKGSHWKTKRKRERDFSVFFHLHLYLLMQRVSVLKQVMCNITAAIVSEYSCMAHFQVQRWRRNTGYSAD